MQGISAKVLLQILRNQEQILREIILKHDHEKLCKMLKMTSELINEISETLEPGEENGNGTNPNKVKT